MEYFEPSDIEIYTWDKGIVIKDNSMIAIDDNGKTIAIGREAQYIQQTGVEIYSPIREGQLADWEASKKVITWYVMKAWKGHLFKKPRIAVCIMPNSTDVEKKAMEDAMFSAGAKKIFLTELKREDFILEVSSKEFDLIISIGQNFRNIF